MNILQVDAIKPAATYRFGIKMQETEMGDLHAQIAISRLIRIYGEYESNDERRPFDKTFLIGDRVRNIDAKGRESGAPATLVEIKDIYVCVAVESGPSRIVNLHAFISQNWDYEKPQD